MAGSLLQDALQTFTLDQKFKGKGPLCVALIVTQHAKTMGLPLDSRQLVTTGGGQVLGLGKAAVQAVLNRHKITRMLASEGGRTSRGSLGNMQKYVAFLNERAALEAIDLEAVERYWVARVHEFFAAKPFKIQLDSSKSLRTVVRHILTQAEERQQITPGVYYVGAVMQHLVGAKLDCALGTGKFTHNSFSTADAPSNRAGDFFIGDVAIHVTTSPGEAVIAKCAAHLNDGFRPLLITLQRGLVVAEGLADNVGIADRIDIFEIEQFIALNLYELGKFVSSGRRTAVSEIATRYNQIIEEFETDPSFKIEMR